MPATIDSKTKLPTKLHRSGPLAVECEKHLGVKRHKSFFEDAMSRGDLAYKMLGSFRHSSVQYVQDMIDAATQRDLERRGLAKAKQPAFDQDAWTARAKTFQGSGK